MAPSLLDLPHEVLHSIFSQVEPSDLAHLPCCRTLYSFLQSDRLLYKDIYLNNFDNPQIRHENDCELSWEDKLHEIVKIGKILQSADGEDQMRQLPAIVSVVEYLLRTAETDTGLGSYSNPIQNRFNLSWLDRHFNCDRRDILSGSLLYNWATTHAWQQPAPSSKCFTIGEESVNQAHGSHQFDPHHGPPRARELCAKLHCLYGVPIQDLHRTSSGSTPTRYHLRSESAQIHPYARSRTYDLRQHTDGTFWGPFRDDGLRSVDWEKLEAIMLISDYNLKRFASVRELGICDILPNWTAPFKGASPYSYVPRPTSIPLEPPLPLEARDPYNITGTWTRIVCFLDYTELFDFNFSGPPPPPSQPRPPIDTEEAIRLITMKIYVSKIEEPGEEDGKALPKVWFKGMSSSVRPSWDPNANSKIRGCVRLTPEGEVHWTSWSIFHGEERWRSEGIQIGGVQSGRGILGFWFDKDFDAHGPAGPTAFWKDHDGIKKKDSSDNRSTHGSHAFHMPMY